MFGEKFENALRTTRKQIVRSGWLALASIAVMTLAFVVSTIFSAVAYWSNQLLINLEQQPQIYVFFEIGVEQAEAERLQEKWNDLPGVLFTEYTSESEAKAEFTEDQRRINELAARSVEKVDLPSSISVKLTSLSEFETVSGIIEEEAQENNNINQVLYSSEVIDNIRKVLFIVRFVGVVIMIMLIVVLIFFTLLTVEFKTHSRSKEIEIMQLVGGSLSYIRLPFIMEGMFYGLFGSILSNFILIGVVGVIYLRLQEDELAVLNNLFGGIDFPEVTVISIALLFLITAIIGIILGGFNSFVAIRRYIK